MKDLYFVNIRFSEPTEIYKLVPQRIASKDMATLEEIKAKLKSIGADNILIDSSFPEAVDYLKKEFIQVRGMSI